MPPELKKWKIYAVQYGYFIINCWEPLRIHPTFCYVLVVNRPKCKQKHSKRPIYFNMFNANAYVGPNHTYCKSDKAGIGHQNTETSAYFTLFIFKLISLRGEEEPAEWTSGNEIVIYLFVDNLHALLCLQSPLNLMSTHFPGIFRKK
jgi:hypothetical protein